VIGPDIERTTFDDLADMIRADYKANRRDTPKRLDQSLAHLLLTFGGRRASDVTPDRIARYAEHRSKEGAAPATINRELSALKRAFRLGLDRERVSRIPPIKMLREDNVRRGFFEEDQFRAIRVHLSPHLQAVVTVAYLTGWRIPSDILTRQWRHVDMTAGWLRLEPGEAKNERGRMFPLTGKLRDVLEAQRRATDAYEAESGRTVPWVFHDHGRRVGNFRKTWIAACVAAGLGSEVRDAQGRLVSRSTTLLRHDFRRTAVRNIRAPPNHRNGGAYMRMGRTCGMLRIIPPAGIVLLLAMAGPSVAGDWTIARTGHHDCRIATIEVRARRQIETGLYHLTAIYRARDGHALTTGENCPDQSNPSWSIGNGFAWADSPDNRALDLFGFDMLVRLNPGQTRVMVATTQRDVSGDRTHPTFPYVIVRGERAFVAR
jgi:site-specific recombinase XerD